MKMFSTSLFIFCVLFHVRFLRLERRLVGCNVAKKGDDIFTNEIMGNLRE